ncbi:MAG: TPM domain-containing protein [Bacteroidetes bacterium]|nr:MAG: TPM domain-containing protein [Bacteroidota bacterium]
MLSFGAKKASDYFSAAEREQILAAIRASERLTSGELRLFVETKCRYVNPIDRAEEVFFGLQMEATEQRNGVLIYMAMGDRQFAIFADKGIYEAMGSAFWHQQARHIQDEFKKVHYADGVLAAIHAIGQALATHFPFDPHIDKNELPDDIVFGK